MASLVPPEVAASGFGRPGAADMDPRLLFPWLALGFAVAAVLRLLAKRRLDGMARTWGLLAVIFALVSAWLRFHF